MVLNAGANVVRIADELLQTRVKKDVNLNFEIDGPLFFIGQRVLAKFRWVGLGHRGAVLKSKPDMPTLTSRRIKTTFPFCLAFEPMCGCSLA